jgi:hypothetical protein
MRTAVIAVTAVATLALAGIAIAHGVNSKSVTGVSAAFSAPAPTNVKSSSCTAANGDMYVTTRATYTGSTTGASDPSLAGSITLDLQSLVNTKTDYGVVTGHLRIAPTTGGHTDAHFKGVVHGGTVVGLAEGHATSPHSQLIANLSGAFTTTGASGTIGGGTAAGYAVEVTEPGGCNPPPPPHPAAPVSKPNHVQAHGPITAISTTTGAGSISVAGVTCSIPDALLAQVAGLGLAVGSQVEIHCSGPAGATPALDQLEAPGHHHVDVHGHKH